MKIEKKKIKDLIPAFYNPRRSTPKQEKNLAESLKKFGVVEPIIWNKQTKNIVGGHFRVRELEKLGFAEVDCVVIDLSLDDEKELNIRLNANTGDWDWPALDEQFDFKQLETWGLEFPELEGQEEKLEAKEDDFESPPIEEIKTDIKHGDIIQIGPHRLMCGDSTELADVERLMDGKKADMMFTDPPYGVNYEGGHFHSGDVNIKRKREKLSADDSTQIYFEFLPVALKFVDGPCYMWFAGSKARDVYNSVHECGAELHALIIWHKTNATYAAMNAQYKQRHEPCLYFKPKGSTLRWCGATTEATVWSQDRDGINEFHPTQKPISLASKALGNHDAKNCLDLFLGSGSTMVACHQLKRVCYGMELEPKYCQVIVDRMKKLDPDIKISKV